MEPTRDDAWKLLSEYTKNPSLIKHALAVEAAMRAYAARSAQDQDLWGITGLIHDFDYEQHPTADEHPMAGVAILRALGWPQEIVEAVAGHAREASRTSLMSRVLFSVDELTGLVAACALVQPDKNVANLKVASVRKKWKDKAFARAVNRQDIELGARELGVGLDDHIAFVIDALRPVARELGLAGA